MKKSFKKALTVLSVIMVVGVFCVVAGVAMGGSISYQISLPNKAVNVTKDYISNTVELDGFESVSVYESNTNVCVKYGETYSVTYKYRAVDAPHIEVENGQLFINVERSFESRANVFLDETLTFFDFGNDAANELVITVPDDADIYEVNIFVDYGNVYSTDISAHSMQLYANCGNVSVNGGKFEGGVYCDAQNGNVTVKNLTCSSFVGVPYNSNMVVNSLDTGKLDIVEAYCANIELENCSVSDFEMVIDSGNLTVDNLICNTFNIDSKYSNADVIGLKTKKLCIEDEYGNMDFELVGEKEKYGLNLIPISSNVEINGEEQPKTVINTDSEYLIKANSSYGNIYIDFTNE